MQRINGIPPLNNSGENNPLRWFEIPTIDLNRAAAFYQTILAIELRREHSGGGDMAIFPYAEPYPSGALVAYPAFPPHKFRPPPTILVDDQPLSYIEATISLTAPISLTGSPVFALPAGIVEGLPVGLQVVGRRWQEDRLLQCSRILEDCLGTNLPPALAI